MWSGVIEHRLDEEPTLAGCSYDVWVAFRKIVYGVDAPELSCKDLSSLLMISDYLCCMKAYRHIAEVVKKRRAEFEKTGGDAYLELCRELVGTENVRRREQYNWNQSAEERKEVTHTWSCVENLLVPRTYVVGSNTTGTNQPRR